MFALMDPAMGWDELEELASGSSLPIVVKGILTGEDAALACEHGAAGVVVSNHGGRQLDGATATIEALPEVVDAVEGRVEVLVDGGIRRGADVVKALALGARAVLAGRAPLWGLAARGEQGAREVLELLHDEIELAQVLVGGATPADVGHAHVARAAV
jgi:isopentenyl diphosphate isomerase/L-lactate dehydrogenase-like FMN-dependent dehydrogenase